MKLGEIIEYIQNEHIVEVKSVEPQGCCVLSKKKLPAAVFLSWGFTSTSPNKRLYKGKELPTSICFKLLAKKHHKNTWQKPSKNIQKNIIPMASGVFFLSSTSDIFSPLSGWRDSPGRPRFESLRSRALRFHLGSFRLFSFHLGGLFWRNGNKTPKTGRIYWKWKVWWKENVSRGAKVIESQGFFGVQWWLYVLQNKMTLWFARKWQEHLRTVCRLLPLGVTRFWPARNGHFLGAQSYFAVYGQYPPYFQMWRKEQTKMDSCQELSETPEEELLVSCRLLSCWWRLRSFANKESVPGHGKKPARWIRLERWI